MTRYLIAISLVLSMTAFAQFQHPGPKMVCVKNSSAYTARVTMKGDTPQGQFSFNDWLLAGGEKCLSQAPKEFSNVIIRIVKKNILQDELVCEYKYPNYIEKHLAIAFYGTWLTNSWCEEILLP